MKWVVFAMLLAMMTLLSSGMLVTSLETHWHACYDPDILFTYLDMDHINASYPSVDHNSILQPVLEQMLEHPPGFAEPFGYLIMAWIKVCRAEYIEEEISAWKYLASEIHHTMHMDQSISDIANILFDTRIMYWIMDNHDLLYTKIDLEDESCVQRLMSVWSEHCGPISPYIDNKHCGTFIGMCQLGVEEYEFADAASRTCGDYSFIEKEWPY